MFAESDSAIVSVTQTDRFAALHTLKTAGPLWLAPPNDYHELVIGYLAHLQSAESLGSK